MGPGNSTGRVIQKAPDDLFQTYKGHIQPEYADSTEIALHVETGHYNTGTGNSEGSDDDDN